MSYDPWADLRSREHLTFGITDLPAGDGWWLPEVPGIVLDSRLTRVQRRCVLSHELVHAERDDRQCADGGEGSRQARRREREADEIAASRLIPLERLAYALRVALGPDDVAEELDVTVDVLRARLLALTEDEKAWIESQVARLEESA